MSLIKGRHTSIESITNTKKMLLIGSFDFPCTPYIYLLPGNAPSLLIANTTRVVTVIWEKPPK